MLLTFFPIHRHKKKRSTVNRSKPPNVLTWAWQRSPTQNARAQYDTVLANEVTARNNLDNAVEQLRQITGNYYPELAALNVENFKTDKPQPVNALLKEAENATCRCYRHA